MTAPAKFMGNAMELSLPLLEYIAVSWVCLTGCLHKMQILEERASAFTDKRIQSCVEKFHFAKYHNVWLLSTLAAPPSSYLRKRIDLNRRGELLFIFRDIYARLW
jgi:hypothetical protein